LGRLIAWSQPAGLATGEAVEVSGEKFEFAWRATLSKALGQPWMANANLPLAPGLAVPAGHCVVFSARVRAVTPMTDGQGRLMVRLQLNTAPFSAMAVQEFAFAKDWVDLRFSCASGAGLPAGSHSLNLQFGYGAQSLDIAQLKVLDLGEIDPESTGIPVAKPDGN
jgi:hypothetical protein